MSNPVLHYIFDAFCGWCYGAAPLVDAARIDGLAITIHGGGMMAGAGRQRVTPDLRNFVMQHDQRIATLSGQPFGDAYQNVLLKDTTAVFDSEPPTTAILAAEESGSRGLDMLKRLQQAHFIEGQRIADKQVLLSLGAELGLEKEAFASKYAALSGAATQQHISQSRTLLGRFGGQGFPTFAVVRDNQATVLEFGRYLGRPNEWKSVVENAIA
jgi:putative protein-disulfide isomerase